MKAEIDLKSILMTKRHQSVLISGDVLKNIDILLNVLNIKSDHPDLIFLKNEEDKLSVSVDQVRSLQSRLNISPFYGTYYVIIPFAKNLNTSCYNALLKILEEPKNTWFFLLTTDASDLSDTIKSRCLSLNFDKKVINSSLVDELLNDLIIVKSDKKILLYANKWSEKITNSQEWFELLFAVCEKIAQKHDLAANRNFLNYLNEIYNLSSYGVGILQIKKIIDRTFLFWFFVDKM